MKKTIKSLSIAGVCAALLAASAFAETTWKPPSEIAPKAAEAGAAEAGETAAPAAPAAPQSAAEKQKSCDEQAKAKGLKGKAKKQFKADCLKA
ncbi:hypothetical protein AMST5_00365 [freshwater sediment metagenome]|uniref:Phosphate starvation-inducible protein PsiF n=1 Tax=freshwater sediment metagenome TaxID=556182 RepID=A0AA48R938_9ZZZZ